MRLILKNFLAVAALVAGAFLAPAQAHAAFTVTLHEAGFADQTFNDGGTGHIVVNTSIGNFTFNADIASSNSASGTVPATLTLNSESATSTGGGTLVITAQDTGFHAPTGAVTATNKLTVTSVTNSGSVSQQTFINGSLTGTALSLSGVNTTGIVNTGNATVSNPFTLTLVSTITLSANGDIQTTGNTTVSNAVPAPAGLVLALTGLPIVGLGHFLRRRRKQA